MKSFLSLWLTFIFALTSIAPAFSETKSVNASTCEDGECIPGLVDKLEKLGSLYQKQCLPKGIKEAEILISAN